MIINNLADVQDYGKREGEADPTLAPSRLPASESPRGTRPGGSCSMEPGGVCETTWDDPRAVADRVGLGWLDGPTRMRLPAYLRLWAERVERDRMAGPSLVAALWDAAADLERRGG